MSSEPSADSMPSTHVDRRAVLNATGVALGAVALSGGASGHAVARSPDASLTFEDQTSDGRSVVVAEATADVEFTLTVFEGDPPPIGGGPHLTFPAGETLTDHRITLDEPLAATTTLRVQLGNAATGETITRAEATVTVEDVPERIDGIDPTLVDAAPDEGFNYPYYLYAPVFDADDDPRPILVEPTNTGSTSDDFETHRQAGQRTVERGPGRTIADQLPAPFVVPVFPRPSRNPVDSTHYVHQLDTETLAIEDGDLQRVDQQLLAMVEDARNRLADRDYPVADGMMLNGFSASGNFVDRFSALHPEEVTSVTAGGLNGMPILPFEERKGHTLPYHIGVADLASLTGESFDAEAFREVDRFLYMGDLDRNDTIPGRGSFTTPELRETALAVFGPDPVTDRFPYARAVYDEFGGNSAFRMYENAGHTPQPAIEDAVAFHRRTLAGEDIETIRADLGGNVPNLFAHIEYDPAAPAVGEQVAFDATRSQLPDGEIADYSWEFGDDTTQSGDLVTHTFDTDGSHNVRLVVTDTAGERYEDTVQVSVGSDDAEDDTDASEDSMPGFGPLGTLVGLATGGYVLTRRLESDSSE